MYLQSAYVRTLYGFIFSLSFLFCFLFASQDTTGVFDKYPVYLKFLRNLWFYCTLYELAPAGLEDVAAVTPPLATGSAHHTEEIVVELGAMLSGMQVRT